MDSTVNSGCKLKVVCIPFSDNFFNDRLIQKHSDLPDNLITLQLFVMVSSLDCTVKYFIKELDHL